MRASLSGFCVVVGCVFGDVSRETWWFVWGGCCGFVGWDHVALVVG